jgi:hypothetical protein
VTSAWEPALGDAFQEHKCRQVDDSVLADIWVSRDPAKPSGKHILCAGMKRVVWLCPLRGGSPLQG